MKKIVALCFGLAALAAAPLLAQGNSDNQTFIFNGKSWFNKQAFIDNARCSTRAISEDERAEIDAKLAAFKSNNGNGSSNKPGGGGGGGGSVNGGAIDVYFH